MSFTSSLERLLMLRRSLERQEEMKLALIAAKLQAAMLALRATQEARSHASSGRFSDGARSGSFLQISDLQYETACARERQLQTELSALRSAHQEQCAVLLERTRERKILETLRERQLAAQRREQLRRMQASLDELFLLRPR